MCDRTTAQRSLPLSTPPPPQGGYHPHGQPSQPQYGYPQQGGYPGAPAPQPPPRRSRINQQTKIKAIVFTVAAIGAGVWIFTHQGKSTDTPSTPAARAGASASQDANSIDVGECVEDQGSDNEHPDLEVVPCGDSRAEYKVEESVGDECAPGQARYTVTRRGHVQSMLCLSPTSR
ncbi:LppU/SCO3897 family protein [Streptomyces sp. P1-3]|uniref:LppU/SCO3897 family protein n=1 Tax=Streptomyces sp. P1-3 TaxID=3421658 RepID=UPI003D364D33